MTGFVYAIGDGEGRVKIGWSADPLRRLSKINSDCPGDAQLLGVIEATKEQETEAHELLAPWLVSGEWFRLEGPVRTFVGMLPPPKPKLVDLPLNCHPLKRWRKENRITLEVLADRLSVTAGHLSMIESDQKLPSLGLAAKLSEFTRLQIDVFVREAAE
jgi:DNA-binding XRE family transcriptional regulator